MGFVEAQPKTLSFVPSARGRTPLFSRSIVPSSAISTARADASAEVSSVIVPLPLIRSSMVLIGPVQIMFTQTQIPATAAIKAVPLMRRLPGFAILLTAIWIMIATRMMTPIAIR